MIAPASILVVGHPDDIRSLLVDQRTKRVLGDGVKARIIGPRAVAIIEFSKRKHWDDAERHALQLAALNPDLALAAVPLVRDMPAGIPLRAYANVDEIRADGDYVEDLEDELCWKIPHPGSRLEQGYSRDAILSTERMTA